MKWQGKRQSRNVDDRRGRSGGGGGGFNLMLLAPLFRFLFTKTGLIIVGILIAIMWIFGINPLTLLSNFTGGSSQSVQTSQPYTPTAQEEELASFSKTILADTEDTWKTLIKGYRAPTLVLFTGSVSSACGGASAATGPFYCPVDERVYLDLSFFEDMSRKLNAPGDFAEAYVIAHEVGHHVQKLMGISDKVQSQRSQISKAEYNRLSVKLELQADFLAGVWAHYSQERNHWLEEGDMAEALNAANAIGDDRLQKQATGRVVPDAFTHGTSAQRMHWFKLGYDTGDINQGDTFSDPSL